MNTEQYTEIKELLMQIINNQKPPRSVVGVSTTSREKETMRVFTLLSSFDHDKRYNYRFPTEIAGYQDGATEKWVHPAIIPLSLFINRLELLKPFIKLDGEISSRANAITTIANCKELHVSTMGQAGLRDDSTIQIVMSKWEAQKLRLIKRPVGFVEESVVERENHTEELKPAVPVRRIPTREECEDEVADDLPPMADEEPEESDGDREERLDRERDAAGKATKHKKALSNVVFDWSAVAKEDAEAEQREKDMKEASVRVAEADKKKKSVFNKQ